MKVNKTYFEIKIIDALLADYLIRNNFLADKKYTDKQPTVFASAAKNILNQIAKHFLILNDEIDSLKIKNCACDPVTKVQLKGPNDNFGNPTRQFTSEGELQLKSDLKALMKVEVELHARIIKEVDLDFKPTDEEREAYTGILLEPLTENKN